MNSNRFVALALIAVGAAILLAGFVFPPNSPAPPVDLRPNPSPEIRAIIAQATGAQIRRVHADRTFRLERDLFEDGSLSPELLSAGSPLAIPEFEALQHAILDPSNLYNATPYHGPLAKACIFHPDVQVEFIAPSGEVSMTLIACFGCGEWIYHGSGIRAGFPASSAEPLLKLVAASHFPHDVDLQRYVPRN